MSPRCLRTHSCIATAEAAAALIERVEPNWRIASTATASSRAAGEIPAAHVHELRRRLPGLTRGEGVLESAFARYRPVRGPIPARERVVPEKMAS